MKDLPNSEHTTQFLIGRFLVITLLGSLAYCLSVIRALPLCIIFKATEIPKSVRQIDSWPVVAFLDKVVQCRKGKERQLDYILQTLHI